MEKIMSVRVSMRVNGKPAAAEIEPRTLLVPSSGRTCGSPARTWAATRRSRTLCRARAKFLDRGLGRFLRAQGLTRVIHFEMDPCGKESFFRAHEGSLRSRSASYAPALTPDPS